MARSLDSRVKYSGVGRARVHQSRRPMRPSRATEPKGFLKSAVGIKGLVTISEGCVGAVVTRKITDCNAISMNQSHNTGDSRRCQAQRRVPPGQRVQVNVGHRDSEALRSSSTCQLRLPNRVPPGKPEAKESYIQAEFSAAGCNLKNLFGKPDRDFVNLDALPCAYRGRGWSRVRCSRAIRSRSWLYVCQRRPPWSVYPGKHPISAIQLTDSVRATACLLHTNATFD
jgi:hypothetical protein